jgi:kinesin family member 1
VAAAAAVGGDEWAARGRAGRGRAPGGAPHAARASIHFPALAGIIPIACERIFQRIDAARAEAEGGGGGGPNTVYRVEASMLEIYKEAVRDLFAAPPAKGSSGGGGGAPPTGAGLRVREGKSGFYVEGLTRCAVGSYDAIARLMEAGTRARTVAATAMNATSSRAHTVFQVTLTQTTVDRAKGTATDKT